MTTYISKNQRFWQGWIKKGKIPLFGDIMKVVRTSIQRKGVKTLKAINSIAFILVVVGALNWGLVGLFGFDLVKAIFGGIGVANYVYDLVGISALLVAYNQYMK